MTRSLLIFSLATVLAVSAQATHLQGPLSYATGTRDVASGAPSPRGLASADLNGDGKADVVVANFGSSARIGQTPTASGNLQLFKGSADGLAPWMTLATGNNPRGVVIADLNGDGRLDIAATFYGDGSMGIYLQQPDGSFSAVKTAAVGVQPVGISVGDLGGKPVIAVANYGSSTVSLLRVTNGAPVLLSTLTVATNPVDVKFYSPAAAKQPVLLVAAITANQLSRLSLNNDGSAASRSDGAVSGSPSKIVIADVNGDGLPDAVVAQFTDNKTTTFLGLADGSLSTTGTASALRGSHPNGIGYGALGLAGRVITADRDSNQADLLSWTSQGLSSTAALTVLDSGGDTGTVDGPVEVAVADVNGDGLADLLITHMYGGELKLFLQEAPAAPAVSSSTHPDPAQWYPATQASLSWQAPDDLDPITQYLVVFDQKTGTFPQSGQGATNALGAQFASLASGAYYLHVRAVDAGGHLGDTAQFKVGVTAALSKEDVYNYPNPSRDGHTQIRFPLLAPAAVSIHIYDEMGALVWQKDLGAGDTTAGVNTVEWDGRNGNGRTVGNGGYIYTLSSGSFSVTKKIAIVR